MSKQVQSDRVSGYIYKTKDYDKFKFMEGNRQTNDNVYLKLVESMKEEQLEIPILVNKDFEIIDGQHRFKACKYLELPVFYHIKDDYGIDQVKKANMIGSNWVKEDFLKMFVSQNNATYEYIETLRDAYDVNIGTIIKLFAFFQDKPKTLLSKDFENGTFSLDNANLVEAFLDALSDFKDIQFKHWSSDMFISAFLSLYSYESYDHATIKKKIKQKADIFEKKRSKDDYVIFLCDIYNLRLSDKNKIFYDPNRKTFYRSEV